jgi:hypothetical protein
VKMATTNVPLVATFLSLVSCTQTAARIPDAGQRARTVDASVQPELAPASGWPFVVESAIPACVTVKGGHASTLGNLVLADVTVTSIQGVWECGCMSKSLLFRSVDRYNDIDAELASGVIRSPEPGTSLVSRVLISATPDIPPNGAMVLRMGCRPPP